MSDRPAGDIDPADVARGLPHPLPEDCVEAGRKRHTEGALSRTAVRGPAAGVAQ